MKPPLFARTRAAPSVFFSPTSALCTPFRTRVRTHAHALTLIHGAGRLMLNFYGLKLVNVETGEVARTEEWQERYKNMNILTHNNLRISTSATSFVSCHLLLDGCSCIFWHHSRSYLGQPGAAGLRSVQEAAVPPLPQRDYGTRRVAGVVNVRSDRNVTTFSDA